MKRRITIDEFMSMTLEERNNYFDRKEQLLREGIETEFDTMGMTDEEIVKKYGFTEKNEFFNNLEQKLMSRNGSAEYDRAKGI